jgi:putative SOS response-associated peptidase YedK
LIWLAGMWTRYERSSARVESYAVITRLNRVDDSQALIELKPEDFVDWLEPSTSLSKLERWLQPFGLYKNANLRHRQESNDIGFLTLKSYA